MTIKGYTQGYIVQYVVANLDGTVIDTFDDRETAEACAEEGQQIVELDGYGYVADITDGTEEDVFTADDEDGQTYIFHPLPDQAQNTSQQAGYSEQASYNPGLYPRFPWTRG